MCDDLVTDPGRHRDLGGSGRVFSRAAGLAQRQRDFDQLLPGFYLLTHSGPLGSILSEELEPSFLLERFTDERESFSPKMLESLNRAAFPNPTLNSDGDQMALHHASKVVAARISVVRQISTGQPHSDHLVITRDQEANIAQTVKTRGGKCRRNSP